MTFLPDCSVQGCLASQGPLKKSFHVGLEEAVSCKSRAKWPTSGSCVSLFPKKNTCVSLFIGYLPYKNGPYMALSENSVVPNSMVDDHVSVQIRSAILAYAPLFDGNFPRHMLIHMIHVR